jgi:uncharacterized membrane protein YeaQ/YmgE (transglycosylase-associated protein family)
MTILWTLIVGLIVGAIAKFVMPGDDPGGIIVTMILGIAGSLVASWIGSALGLYTDGSSAGLLMSVFGAVLLLVLYRVLRRAKSTV